ncbi:nitronate monooxygenase [Kineosphaera limosa]|uniref:Propionate 3-nitronate monooxygenase n=1 Tax=Kineosphaera limosa NBRC 100340 TaxID=1184609 RepID=K6WN04_9MICO|nr:nitronate monooxygenase [Kineosphaera limosa]NYE01449.1 nitronate monooxygenase [Kineosphaera limosa]GAB95196.1 putative 2-nitropropane dioxygenase [Kineosphaera limosa NBRC 100340]
MPSPSLGSATVPWPLTPLPVVAAPMAGGPSTPQLAAAVSTAGGLGFLAAGYRSAAEVAAQVRATRALTAAPFGVNVFVPNVEGDAGRQRAQRTAVDAYIDLLSAEAMRLGVELPQPRWDDTDDWDEKIEVLLDDPVAVVSFTFGVPDPQVVHRLHEVGSCVAVTVTCEAEADAAQQAGADALIVQGFEAGGHRGTHDVASTPNSLDHIELLRLLAGAEVPLIAAGGVTTPGDTRRALGLGAVAVQAGTAYLLADEAGTNQWYRQALRDGDRGTGITRAFSGRPARGLRNRFMDTFDDLAPAVFPAVDQLTKPLRARAGQLGDVEGLSLWAGAGWRAASDTAAADITFRLAG